MTSSMNGRANFDGMQDGAPTHVTQITLTDAQLALVLDSVQLGAVVLRLHPDVATNDEAYVKHLFTAFQALESFQPERWVEVLTMLHSAAKEISDPEIGARSAE